jgi:hypothetical protein
MEKLAEARPSSLFGHLQMQMPWPQLLQAMAHSDKVHGAG